MFIAMQAQVFISTNNARFVCKVDHQKGKRLNWEETSSLPLDLEEGGAPARIRTLDQLIKSQLLYQLSYRGNH